MPSPAEIQAIYDKREADVAALKAKGEVTADDLKALDRAGRCFVANDLWPICTEAAQVSLLQDEHAHVKSCAAISKEVAADPERAFCQWFLAKNDVPEGVEVFETFEADGQEMYCHSVVRDAQEQWLSLQAKPASA